MALNKNKKKPINKISRVQNARISDPANFEPKEYDMPRGKTIYEVEVEDEDGDDETIVEKYDNYDEAISAYRRSKLRFPITWVTYLETQKPPYVYERGIVLSNGTLKVMSRKGKDVNYDFNGNEIYANGGGVGDWRKGTSIRYKTKKEAQHRLNLLKNYPDEYRNLRIEKVHYGDKLNDGYDVKFEYLKKDNYAKGGGVGIPNAAWFVFQEKFPEAFEYYLKNNEYGVSKGDLMAMAYESTRNVDSAIPMELRKQVDDTMFYVYDYQNSSFGELVDLREKIKTSEVPVALSFVIDNEVFYGRNLPNELKNADFATALMYVYANRNVIDEFQIRPKRNVDNYAEGGGVGENFKVGDKIKVLGDSYTIVSFRVDNSQGYEEQRVIMKNNKGEILNYPLDMVIAYSKYAKGGEVDMYSKFDFNEKGNLSARINQKNYEIEYNDADGVYELFENGERVQSNKNVRALTQFIQVSDVGNFREGQSVMIAEDNDNENYDDFRGKELVIYHKATNEKEHRGFDNSMEGQALYSFFLRETGEQVPFSLYDFELEQY